MPEQNNPISLNEQPFSEATPFLNFLVELRSRLLRISVLFCAIFIALLPFANHLYHWLALPLLRHLTNGTQMIATNITSPIISPVKFCLALTGLFCVPIILVQLWLFVAPALYRKEKYWIWPILLTSCSLFYGGILFAYFVIFPLIFQVFISMAPKGVLVMPDISSYLHFTLQLGFAFGCAFEVPIFTFLALKFKFISFEKISAVRPYIIVAAFVLGMLLTPPDVLSQVLLAIPLWFLFEVGVLVARWVEGC